MDRHQLIAGIIVLALGIALGYKFIFANNPTIPPIPVPAPVITEVVTPTSSPSGNMVSYKNTQMGFTLSYPKDLTLINNSDGSITLTKFGPTQKQNTDFFDGISLNIVQGNLGTNKDLLSAAQADAVQKQAQLAPDFTLVEPATPYKWYKPGGYVYVTQEPFGAVSYYYLPSNGNNYLLISSKTPDPKHMGFAAVVENIIQSLRIQ